MTYNMTYIDYVFEAVKVVENREPIYTRQIAYKASKDYCIPEKEAAMAIANAFKRIMDKQIIPELRCYQKGIYYKTVITPFGEAGIKSEVLVADKYILPDIGYETGLSLMHKIGLTSQMPNKQVIATNVAKECSREDKKLGVVIKPAKIKINAKNKYYLQALDVIDLLDKAPVDNPNPYALVANHINKLNLQYNKLLALADIHYRKQVVLQLAHVASIGDKENEITQR